MDEGGRWLERGRQRARDGGTFDFKVCIFHYGGGLGHRIFTVRFDLAVLVFVHFVDDLFDLGLGEVYA